MRARSLKPGLFLNEKLGAADPLYTLIFAGLWCLADREGRLEDRPLRIHACINPYRPGASTVLALDWLVNEKFVCRYAVGGCAYLAVANFREHQQPHIKEAVSKLPQPPNGQENHEDVEAPGKHGASTVQTPVEHGSSRSDSGLLTPSSLIPESIVTASVKKRPSRTGARKVQLPDDFMLDPELEQYAIDRLPGVDTQALLIDYRGKATAKGWVNVDWRQAFQTYVRNAMPGSGHFAESQFPRMVTAVAAIAPRY